MLNDLSLHRSGTLVDSVDQDHSGWTSSNFGAESRDNVVKRRSETRFSVLLEQVLSLYCQFIFILCQLPMRRSSVSVCFFESRWLVFNASYGNGLRVHDWGTLA